VKLPAETEAAIVARYRAGASMELVAAAEYVSISTVWRVLDRHGVRSRGHGRPQLGHADYERTIELYELGYGSTDIGRLLGVSSSAIRARLRAAGHPRRKGGTPPRRLTGSATAIGSVKGS